MPPILHFALLILHPVPGFPVAEGPQVLLRTEWLRRWLVGREE